MADPEGGAESYLLRHFLQSKKWRDLARLAAKAAGVADPPS
jgi:hypothetical protein